MRSSKTASASKRPGTSPSKSKRTVTNADGSVTTTTTTRYTVTHLDQGENTQLQLALKQSQIDLEHASNTLVGVSHKMQVFEDLQKDVEEHKVWIRESEQAREDLQVKFVITAKQVQDDTIMKKTYQDSLLEEISDLKKDIQERARLASRKEQEHIDELATQKTQHTDQLNGVKKECSDTVARLTHQHTEEQRRLKTQHSQAMEQQRNHYELKIDELEINLRKCQQTIITLEAKVLELNTILEKKTDVERERDLWKKHHDSMELSKQELQVQLHGASEYIVQLEAKYYESQQTQLEMLKQLKAHEAEIDTLRQYIIDLKSRIAVYIPVKGDSIDKKLAEYINNYPDRQKLKIMFMRESEGVYQFGTKRVSVKCVKDKIQIIVGGGFLSLDEFLDQYTPAELEKLERKDPLRRVTDRIALQKTLQGHAVREERSPSPKK